MSLFQSSVEKKYLRTLDQEQVEQAWLRFAAHFHNPSIQDNIRAAKEEQYQGEFLIDLFVKVLGYTKNPQPNYNLTTELKNVKDSKKADGAIVLPSADDSHKARAVIELKGTKSTDLGKVETQAFGYKNNQPGCTYVIISNFEKLRFYIDDSAVHLEWNLFTLDRPGFDLLYLCLSSDTLLRDIPLKLKGESLSQEEDITKKLYKDYSGFRNDIYTNIQERNPGHDKLTLFKRTQKLLDRFLFIFFAEDRLLLPPNSIRQIIDQWTTLRDELDAYVPLYDRFKKYFGYLNTGHKGKDYDIFAYNGGLFAPDTLLDGLKIDDLLLYTHTQRLSNYDFESEVSVNILGHIFEHSLNDIEEIQAELAGETLDKSKSKRKKDGVFYTPRYITKYIVDNTVGKLCSEKREELSINEEEYYKGRKGRKTETVKKLQSQLEDYREWLLQITICDPACGSGAFLNQAVERLKEEHAYLDELNYKLFGDAIPYPNIENTILENNIYGVDINRESVEIAKLSLWLHTAKKGRKLSSLNDNIKCGNSLIDDPEVAGELAFKWEEEFPEVFSPVALEAYHVVFALHGSRYSVHQQQEKEVGHVADMAMILEPSEELTLAAIMADCASELSLKILSWNICGDHVHALIVSKPDELSQLMGKWKGKSAHIMNRKLYPDLDQEEATHVDGTKNKFWTRSYSATTIKDHKHLLNSINYISNNRTKHELPKAAGLTPLLLQAVVSMEHAPFTSDGKPKTMYEGGFDVVIGNPPYVKRQHLSNQQEIAFLDQNYISATYNFDLYLLFIERGSKLIKDSGLLSYINPSKFTSTKTGEGIRKYLSQHCHIIQYVDFKEYQVFIDATTYCCIFLLEKGEFLETTFLVLNETSPTDISTYNDYNLQIEPSQSGLGWNLKPSLKIRGDIVLESIVNTFTGIESGADNIYILPKGDPYLEPLMKYKNEIIYPTLKGSNLDRYYFDPEPYFSIVPYNGRDLISYDRLNSDYPEITNYLNLHIEDLKGREGGKMNHSSWHGYVYPKNLHKYQNDRLIWTDISIRPQFVIDRSQSWHVRTVCSLELNDSDLSRSLSLEFLQGVLNSSLFFNFIKSNSNTVRGGYYRYKPQYVKQFPIVIPSKIFKGEIVELSIGQQSKTVSLSKCKAKFLNRINGNFEIGNISKKLNAFYDHDFRIFLAELKKQKIILSLTDQDEWEDYFNKYKSEILAIQADIDRTDHEIGQMVYELYGLTEEEIKIVEESVG